jgi:hypothetical protein
MYDGLGRVRLQIGIGDAGATGFGIFDTNGNPRVSIAVGEDSGHEAAQVVLNDTNGEATVELASSTFGGKSVGLLVLDTPSSRVRLSAGHELAMIEINDADDGSVFRSWDGSGPALQ